MGVALILPLLVERIVLVQLRISHTVSFSGNNPQPNGCAMSRVNLQRRLRTLRRLFRESDRCKPHKLCVSALLPDSFIEALARALWLVADPHVGWVFGNINRSASNFLLLLSKDHSTSIRSNHSPLASSKTLLPPS